MLAGQALREKVLTIAAALLGLNSSGELRLTRGQVERRLGGAWTDDRAQPSPISRRSPISIRCGCRPAWSRASRPTRPTIRRR